MPNVTVTDVDLGSVIVHADAYEHDALVTFGGADVYVAGTILARDTSTQKFIAYVKGGSSNGNGVPRAILTHELTATLAGDLAASVLVAGEINQRRLVIDADGDASNVDGNVRDLLRQTGLIAVDVDQLGDDDNPQDS